jgi:hypothetical protein
MGLRRTSIVLDRLRFKTPTASVYVRSPQQHHFRLFALLMRHTVLIAGHFSAIPFAVERLATAGGASQRISHICRLYVKVEYSTLRHYTRSIRKKADDRR